MHLKADLADQGEQVPAFDFEFAHTLSEPSERDIVGVPEEVDELDELDESESESVISNEEDKYAVKAIIGQRGSGRSHEYQVKWIGYPRASWEPASTISHQVPAVVREYEESLLDELPSRVTRSRTATAQSSSSSHIKSPSDLDEVLEESKSSHVMAARTAAADCL